MRRGKKVAKKEELLATVGEIEQAIRDYHYALDTRQHGGVAQGRAFARVCSILGMHWRQDEEAERRSTQ